MWVFMGCVGKGHSWTSSVRVSSHGERREKGVECMGLYLPPLACMVEKLSKKKEWPPYDCSLERAS